MPQKKSQPRRKHHLSKETTDAFKAVGTALKATGRRVKNWLTEPTPSRHHLGKKCPHGCKHRHHVTKAAPRECTVDMYLMVLTHELTKHDQAEAKRESKRGRVNIYRLGLLLEAANKVSADVGTLAGSSSGAAKDAFRASLYRRFEVPFPPVNRVLKQLDAGTCKIK